MKHRDGAGQGKGLAAAPSPETPSRLGEVCLTRFPARTAAPPAHPDPVLLLVVGLSLPSSVTDDRSLLASGTAARQIAQTDTGELPAKIVFCTRPCDKENHGCRHGPPARPSLEFKGGREKDTAFCRSAPPTLTYGPV